MLLRRAASCSNAARFGFAGLVALSCLGRGEPLQLTAAEGDAGAALLGDLPTTQFDAGLDPLAAHSVLSVNPSSGPFRGGSRVIVRGTGFSSLARVWFGEREVPPADILPIDPSRLQVVVAPGDPGPADVTVQNGTDRSSRSTLRAGFVYDAFYASPSVGPTSGGTRITLHGKNVAWSSDTEVTIDREPCTVLAVRDAADGTQELDCETPAGAAGSKPITTRNADDTQYEVLAGFTYSNSDNGFRGGLSGETLDDSLQVLALDNFTGMALSDAVVILCTGSDAQVLATDDQGVLQLDAELGPTVTVTIAKECFHPITFVDVPVDHVTAYLDPVLSPACVPPQQDPPLVPNGVFVSGATVEGELLWTGNREFASEGWINVPPPVAETERRVAYLFETSSNPWRTFSLPRASQAVTEEDITNQGYAFRSDASVGNLTMYALAGVEDLTRDPPLFQAYAMGLVRGVATEPLGTTREVFISMDNTLDQTLRFEVHGPTTTQRGPDRLKVAVAVRIGNEGYAVLPGARRGSLLPTDEHLSFAGLPPLTGSLAGTQYVASARANTGILEDWPHSEIAQISANDSASIIPIEDFVEVPQLVEPATGSLWDGQALHVAWAEAGPAIDLLMVDLLSAGGLVSWRIVAPVSDPQQHEQTLTLPDLATLVPAAGLEPGALQVLLNAAQLTDFDYGDLSYRDLAPQNWRAFATDLYQVRY
jgi:hypothetical protein